MIQVIIFTQVLGQPVLTRFMFFFTHFLSASSLLQFKRRTLKRNLQLLNLQEQINLLCQTVNCEGNRWLKANFRAWDYKYSFFSISALLQIFLNSFCMKICLPSIVDQPLQRTSFLVESLPSVQVKVFWIQNHILIKFHFIRLAWFAKSSCSSCAPHLDCRAGPTCTILG